MNIGGTLTAKYGPLPGWAWFGIAVVGGVLVYRHYQASAGTAAGDTSAGAGVADTGAGAADSGAGYSGSDGGPYYPADPAQPPAPPATQPPKGNVAPVYRLLNVRKGDTLASVARRGGITVARLRQLNPYLRAKGATVHPGDKVLV